MSEQPAFRETIFALSTGRLPSGVAMIRLSGIKTRFALETIAGTPTPEPRTASLRRLRASDGAQIDTGLVLFFPGPRSFTGEDCGELHLHGGRAVVQAVLAELGSMDGLKHAEAGEFTLRAFLNGKLDLTAAEALADLIAAETETQRRLAVRNASGAQHSLYSGWRKRLLHARAIIEAELDFADEADVPGSVSERVWADIAALEGEIETHIQSYSRAEMIRDGVHVVILGAPNAGKSSLLNALAKRDVAIVTDEPGTTRDPLEVALDLEGVKTIVTDTAGLRSGAGKVEALGIDRALKRAVAADLILYLEDAADPVPAEIPSVQVPVVRVGTKQDILPAGGSGHYDHLISAVTGSGLPALIKAISGHAAELVGDPEDALPSRARHVDLLKESARQLNKALIEQAAPLEVRAEILRIAADSLGKIVGAVDVEEMLGAIFSEFCVGK